MLLQVMGLLSHITHIAFGTSVCSPGQDSSKTLEQKKLPPEEAAKLKVQAQGFEDTLKSTPEDQASLEGAGVIYAELGEYDKAVTYLTKLVQVAATTPYLPEQCSILKFTIHTGTSLACWPV
jgi:tetratricopeptide (TPR) repeat protein